MDKKQIFKELEDIGEPIIILTKTDEGFKTMCFFHKIEPHEILIALADMAITKEQALEQMGKVTGDPKKIRDLYRHTFNLAVKERPHVKTIHVEVENDTEGPNKN